jgi:hypothetical protein
MVQDCSKVTAMLLDRLLGVLAGKAEAVAHERFAD